MDWNYSQNQLYKSDLIQDKRRIYMHIYYSGEKALEHATRFIGILDTPHSE